MHTENKRRFCDLHTHSLYSDGTYTPRELIEEAEAAGLSAIALCDHNTTLGLREFSDAARGKSVEAVMGIEFSTDYKDVELHMIALFIKKEQFEKIEEFVAPMKQRKEESNEALIKALCDAGYIIDYEAIKSECGGQVNRAHIADALTKAGYTSSIKEAFATLLIPDGKFYKKPKRIPVFEALDFINSLGAVSVLAHPFLSLREEELRVFLKEAKAHGLVGMETEYSKYDSETTELAKEIAKEFDLSESGGSDFHGQRKPDIALGVGRGELAVPSDFLEKLRKA